MKNKLKVIVRFLGVGSASQDGLGHASAAIEISGKRLLIDCGPGISQEFIDSYEDLPDAIFVTHCHLDHIGDFENLFIKYWFSNREKKLPKLFVPVTIVELLQQRVATYPNVLAEGGVNFWDAFQLIPVSNSFQWQDLQFTVLEVRHHHPKTAFGLQLKDAFFYTGDTRPIPEILASLTSEDELVFHDCGVIGNPSHTGIDDIQREYSSEMIKRIHFYHYTTERDIKSFEKAGLKTITKGQKFEFCL